MLPFASPPRGSLRSSISLLLVAAASMVLGLQLALQLGASTSSSAGVSPSEPVTTLPCPTTYPCSPCSACAPPEPAPPRTCPSLPPAAAMAACPSLPSCPPPPSPSCPLVAEMPATLGVDAARQQSSCALEFVEYVPSRLEQEWKAIAQDFSRGERRRNGWVCEEMGKEPWRSRIVKWLHEGEAYSAALAAQQALEPFMLGALEAADRAPGVFSAMTYRDTCTGKALSIAVEPIAGLLRDPMGPCYGAAPAELRNITASFREQLPQLPASLDLDQTLLSLYSDPAFYRAAAAHVAAVPGSRVLVFDAGSTFFHNPQAYGPGLHWIVGRLHDAGVGYSQMELFAWERSERAGFDYYENVPPELMSRLHFYNYGVDAEAGSIRNPLELIRSRASPADFVVFKLDIDSPGIEKPLLEQLLAPGAPTVNEFFYEPHFYSRELAHCCGWDVYLADEAATLASYSDMFARLRQKGIAAHAWP